METPEGTKFLYLPGADALNSAEHFNSRDDIGRKKVHRFLLEDSHREYLENEVYDRYLQLPKVIVDQEGAHNLIEIGDELSIESMPRYLDAAGWAYAEAGIALHEDSTVHRIQLVKEAERMWHRALVNNLDIERRYEDHKGLDEDSGHRIALNLAFSPLIKSIITGNVTESVRKSVFEDTVAIAMDSARINKEAYEAHDLNAVSTHRGFLYEVSALLTLLNMDDARYIPLPSTARADSGYYHREQTHDISIINQHWGDIRKIIPVEIKSRSSRAQRNRYDALLIRGKMHLSIRAYDPTSTIEVFQKKVEGSASDKELASIDDISNKVRDMLRLYQQGTTAEGIATKSLTRFYDTNKVVEVYPELSKLPRKK